MLRPRLSRTLSPTLTLIAASLVLPVPDFLDDRRASKWAMKKVETMHRGRGGLQAVGRARHRALPALLLLLLLLFFLLRVRAREARRGHTEDHIGASAAVQGKVDSNSGLN